MARACLGAVQPGHAAGIDGCSRRGHPVTFTFAFTFTIALPSAPVRVNPNPHVEAVSLRDMPGTEPDSDTDAGALSKLTR